MTRRYRSFQRPEVRRNDRDDVENHPLRVVSGLAERIENLQALGELLPLRLAGRLLHLDPKLLRFLFDVDLAQDAADRLGADAVSEGVRAELLLELHDAVVRQELTSSKRRLLGVDHDVLLEVEHALEVLQGQLDQVPDAARKRLQEPDVRHWSGERDVAHSLAAHLRLDDLDAALLADHSTVLHALVLAAVALVVLDGTEDLRAEETVAFRLERPVVDRLRLLHLAIGPTADLLRRRDRDPNCRKAERILGPFEEIVEIAHLDSLYWGSSRRSTLSARLCISLMSTLKLSGRPGISSQSPLTIDSYIRVRPTTSSDLTVRNSWSA
jgi:hypothetical protein